MFGDTGAAFGMHVFEQIVHGLERGAVDDLATLPFLLDKPGVDQGHQMMLERRGRNRDVPSDLADVEAGRSGSDQEAEDSEPGLMAQGGKCGGGELIVHEITI